MSDQFLVKYLYYMKSYQPETTVNSRLIQYPAQNNFNNNPSFYQNGQQIPPDYAHTRQNNDREQSDYSFPFGRERQKVSKQIMQKMSLQNDEYNKRMLQKFTIDAIKHRNQRVMKHLGKIPYISESMVLGSSIDLGKIVQRPSLPIRQPMSMPIYRPLPNYTIPVNNPVQPAYPIIKTPRKLPQQSVSIGISANFQQQFPISSKHKKKKRRSYTIQQQKQREAMEKINDLLHQINVKIKRNTQTIQQQHQSISNLQFQKSSKALRQKKYLKTFQQLLKDQNNNRLPSIQYTSKSKGKALKSQGSETRASRQFLREHLQLLKRNKKRLQDLDHYVYN